MFQIIWDQRAVFDLDKFDSSIARRIVKKVKDMQTDPFHCDVRRLQGSSDFRLRVGDYRVIFSIEGKIITILKIGHRKNIYDR